MIFEIFKNKTIQNWISQYAIVSSYNYTICMLYICLLSFVGDQEMALL